MKFKKMTRCSVALALFAIAGLTNAQDTFPNKPIKIIVPNVPGGGSDVIARALALRLQTVLGQPVIVDNRSGGGEIIGIDLVAKASADGYTVLYASNTLTIKPSLYKNLPYKVESDLKPLGNVITDRMYIVVSDKSPFKSLADLTKYAKEHPGKLSYGSPGSGTPHQLAMELYKSAAGLDIVHVPYRGTGPGITDLIGGTIPLLISTSSPVIGHVQTGKARFIAIFDDKRSEANKDVAAISESTPGVKVNIWQGIFAPKGMPSAIATKWTDALKAVTNDEGFKKQMTDMGVAVTWAPPATVETMIPSEVSQWARVTKEAGIQPE